MIRLVTRTFLLSAILFFISVDLLTGQNNTGQMKLPEMYYGDTSRTGRPFSKDPHVIWFRDRYLMYFSIPPGRIAGSVSTGWNIGIAESNDLIHWVKKGEINPVGEFEKNGLCAPSALVLENTVHLFYQTYGNGAKDAICHAFSDDGISFKRNDTNPVFRPTGDWTSGRAIDAEIVKDDNRFLLYYATRDPDMKIQLIGVASAPLKTDFRRSDWTQLTDGPVLKPEFPWEETCTEGASVIRINGWYYMFYAGAYNNRPQQIGLARSRDGVKWNKISNKPFLQNGDPGTWNSSESGHPHIFMDRDGRTWLFFQGNNDSGKTWYLSKIEILWNEDGPFIKPSADTGSAGK